MIVAKAVRMAEMMHVPVIGLVENYSYFRCPDCGKCHQIFGKSHLDETAQAYHLPVLARLPIDPAVAEACDAGRVESLDTTRACPAGHPRALRHLFHGIIFRYKGTNGAPAPSI